LAAFVTLAPGKRPLEHERSPGFWILPVGICGVVRRLRFW
jgi:hypothetical protein